MLRRPKRGSCQAIKIKIKWKKSMKTNEKMMNMMRILAQESMLEDVKKIIKNKNFQCLNLKYCILGKYHKGFEPFISFLSITWTRPTLQLLNEALLEVLLIESTHWALIIFSLGLRRKLLKIIKPHWLIYFTNCQVNKIFF